MRIITSPSIVSIDQNHKIKYETLVNGNVSLVFFEFFFFHIETNKIQLFQSQVMSSLFSHSSFVTSNPKYQSLLPLRAEPNQMNGEKSVLIWSEIRMRTIKENNNNAMIIDDEPRPTRQTPHWFTNTWCDPIGRCNLTNGMKNWWKKIRTKNNKKIHKFEE